MIRACEWCGAATRRPKFCSELCGVAGRQRRSRAKDRARLPIESISASLTIAMDDWQPSPDVEAAWNDEIAWKRSMILASRRKRRPIPQIDRPDPGEDAEEKSVA